MLDRRDRVAACRDLGVGQDSVPLDDHSTTHHLHGILLDPGPHGVGQPHLGELLDDGIGRASRMGVGAQKWK